MSISFNPLVRKVISPFTKSLEWLSSSPHPNASGIEHRLKTPINQRSMESLTRLVRPSLRKKIVNLEEVQKIYGESRVNGWLNFLEHLAKQPSFYDGINLDTGKGGGILDILYLLNQNYLRTAHHCQGWVNGVSHQFILGENQDKSKAKIEANTHNWSNSIPYLTIKVPAEDSPQYIKYIELKEVLERGNAHELYRLDEGVLPTLRYENQAGEEIVYEQGNQLSIHFETGKDGAENNIKEFWERITSLTNKQDSDWEQINYSYDWTSRN